MKSPNLFGGLLLIFLGAIFLLNNFGYIGWDIWFTLLSFWPLFLIALGLLIMFKSNLLIQTLAVLLIMVLPLAYYVGYGPLRPFPGMKMPMVNYENHSWSMERESSLRRAQLKLQYGAGKLTVHSADKLVDLQAATAAGRPDVNVNQSSDSAQISIGQGFSPLPFFGHSRRGGWSEDWNVGLARDVIWELEFETGATKAEFNLQELKVTRLDLETGAGDVRLSFGDTGMTSKVEIDSGAGSITLVIPESVGIKAKINSGVGQKNLTGRTWQQQGDTYVSQNYEQAQTKLELDIDHAAGNINIMTQ